LAKEAVVQPDLQSFDDFVRTLIHGKLFWNRGDENSFSRREQRRSRLFLLAISG
jgi:hypothetical protein